MENINDDLKNLYKTIIEADDKFNKAKASKDRAQKTLSKSQRTEKSAS